MPVPMTYMSLVLSDFFKSLGLEIFARGRGLGMSESAIYGIEMVIVLPLSLKESVDPAPSFAVGKYNFAVPKYNFAVRWQVHGGVAAVEEPGHVPPARPQQLLHAVAEEPWTQQHFYK